MPAEQTRFEFKDGKIWTCHRNRNGVDVDWRPVKMHNLPSERMFSWKDYEEWLIQTHIVTAEGPPELITSPDWLSTVFVGYGILRIECKPVVENDFITGMKFGSRMIILDSPIDLNKLKKNKELMAQSVLMAQQKAEQRRLEEEAYNINITKTSKLLSNLVENVLTNNPSKARKWAANSRHFPTADMKELETKLVEEYPAAIIPVPNCYVQFELRKVRAHFQKIGYKIVSVHNQKYYSYISALLPYNTLPIEYIPGKPTFPKIQDSPLFLFDNLEEANQYIEHFGYSNHELWKCEYEPHPSPRQYIIKCICSYNDEMVEKMLSIDEKMWEVYAIPRGVQASSITLLHKLERV